MRKSLALLALTAIFFTSVSGQKASDVIENGIKVKEGNEVFVLFDGTNILYQQNTAPNLHFKTIGDSAMLLPVDGSLIFYLKPLNPLNYSYKAENKIIVDPIDEAAATALTSIIDFTKKRVAEVEGEGEEKAKSTFCPNFSGAVALYNRIMDSLKKETKETIKTTFNSLKKLSFDKEEDTKEGIGKAEATIAILIAPFDSIENNIKALKTMVEKTLCDDKNEDFVIQRLFADATKDLEVTFSNQKKRLTNLEKTLNLVKATQEEASKFNWLTKLAEVPATKGKISVFTVKVNEAGYKLSDEGEIVEAETKEKTSKVLSVRRFQRFVPEVSVGVAHTNLSFPKYSANPDAAGKFHVTEAGEDKINQVNFTSMINYNFFLTNSPLHPFWQLGVGVNADFPTLLTGVGFRINATGFKRLALAFGIATTWIKSLNKLEPGKEVTGPADVEKDLTYKFNTKPQRYFGVQYNF